jgi:hypothetical protein
MDEYGDWHPAVEWLRCPHGQPGQRLWVKERALYWTGGAGGTHEVAYADDPEIFRLYRDQATIDRVRSSKPAEMQYIGNWEWQDAEAMPQHYSRLTAENVGVRVEQRNGVWMWGITLERRDNEVE